MNDDIEIKFVDSWPAGELVELYRAAGWWKDHYKPEGLASLISGSFAFAVAVEPSGRAIGMGRAISDGVSDAYIQDVAVLPEFRGQGIGGSIIKKIIEYCLVRKLAWIGLIAEQGSSPFYEKLGFYEFPGEPMLYRMKE